MSVLEGAGQLKAATGIENVLPDPYFVGGGLHQIQRGGKLGIHADYSRHDRLPLERRINVLIYLNRDWKEEYGGALELWGPERDRCGVSDNNLRTMWERYSGT